jgi:hypothetical protein
MRCLRLRFHETEEFLGNNHRGKHDRESKTELLGPALLDPQNEASRDGCARAGKASKRQTESLDNSDPGSSGSGYILPSPIALSRMPEEMISKPAANNAAAMSGSWEKSSSTSALSPRWFRKILSISC